MKKIFVLGFSGFINILVINVLYTSQTLGLENEKSYPPFKLPANKEFSFLKDYRSKWIKMTNMAKSSLHWNQNVIVYVNKNPEIYKANHNNYLKWNNAIEADEDTEQFKFTNYPEGTVILKESHIFNNNNYVQPASLNLMIKHKKEYDPTTGGWQFAQISNHGDILLSGNSKNKVANITCIQCHKNIPERDFVFSTLDLKK